MTVRPCIYATSGWGIHDVRWTEALEQVGFDPHIVRLGIDASTPGDLREQVSAIAQPNTPILAGPLDSVTVHLVGLGAPIIGLSWGFDLQTMPDREWLPRLRGLIVDSEATARIAQVAGLGPQAITYLPWGVDIDHFTPDGPQADLTRWGVPTSSRTVLSLRAHEPLYRVSDVLEGCSLASRKITDVHLLVGHGGSLTETLRAQARRLGINARTHFIGSLPEEDLPGLLRAVDVYVSASEVDGTSVTLLQAMACGTPVLTSDVPGNQPWVLQGRTGHLFRTGSPEDLSRQLIQVLATPANATAGITKEARELVLSRAHWESNVFRLRSALSPVARD